MIQSHHWSDSTGMPTGGTTSGRGFTISWQNGPLGRGGERLEPNGAFVEDVIKAALDRIEYYQGTRFASAYNAEAIVHLNAALRSLHNRTADREKRDVEGTHET
jgi:hypothetical protein